MLAHELVLYDFMHRYANTLLSDVDDSRLAEQPIAGMNHPAWILGHLRVAEDSVVRMLGRSSDCPDAWYDLFEPGTSPMPDPRRTIYPTKDELLSGWEGVHQELRTAASEATAETLSAENTNSVLKRILPTLGHLVAHVMTTHAAIHCGQITAWRRALGLPLVTPAPKIR